MARIIENAPQPNTERLAGTLSSSRTVAGAVSSLLTLCAGLSATPALAAKPPLPTPCLAANCGTSAAGFVQYGTAGAVVSGTTMNVTQTTSKAILNWADFNIANGYTVNFVQPSQTASVLNKIWSADPSVIAGALKANGQVYLYNQNGILFDKGAQINVGSLTASTLGFAPVNGDPDALFKNGLLSNNANATAPGTLPAVFTACTGSPCTATPGAVTVNSGATLTAADGGRIMLIGSAVTNNGRIVTPDGQTVLGAGGQVYLAASSDPALRGLLIEVNAAGTSGTATNNGVITADRGNITVAGLVVNQAGQMTATTSVSANGSIYLVAGDTSSQSGAFLNNAALGFGKILPNNGGTATLKPGSVTEVLPDSTDTGTISEQNLAAGSSFVPSQVEVVGQTVAMVGNASIHAPGGAVTLSASNNPAAQFPAAAAAQRVEGDTGRIYLDSNSTIDASGLQNVAVPVTQSLLTVTLEGTDLADDPQLRSGFLHGQAVVVNANQGSPLFNVNPYKGNISEGINQVLTSAGTISLRSDGDVIANAGSKLNVSGGSVAYQSGYGPSTTKLVAANGQVYDIGSAPANLQYTGIANSYSYVDPTWGTKTSASAQTFYSGYTLGANAGSVNVQGSQIYLGGSLLGSTIVGPYQRSATSLPAGGQLTVGCGCGGDYGAPAIVFLDSATAALPSNFNYLDPNSTLPAVLQTVTELSPTTLAQDGFNRISVFSNGAVTLPQGVNMTLAPGGLLSVLSDQLIDIAGTIRAPGATVSLATVGRNSGDTSPHNITIDSGAVIDTSGGWVNDSPLVSAVPGAGPIQVSGGKIALTASGNVLLQDDSRLDVSGGGWVSSTNALTKGNAGTISLNASLQVLGSAFTGAVQIAPGAELLGNSLAPGGGGTLSISSGSVTLGWVSTGLPGELLLTPTFFNNSGFGTYNITGQNGLSVGSSAAGSPAVLINPVEENLVFTGNSLLQPTGTALASFTQLEALPPSQRVAANLNLTTTATQALPGVPDVGNLFVASNASIMTDPGGSVSLQTSSNTGSITVLGSILAPAGKITLQLGNPLAPPLTPSGFGYEANQVILLGPNASLEAPAFALVDTLDPLGYREGSVLAGGTVSLVANRGYVVTDQGSVIDVSGAATALDIVTGKGVVPTIVAGNAGSISIDAREGLVLQGTLRGEAAQRNGVTVPGAGGGTLNIGLDLFDYQSTVLTDAGGVAGNPYPEALRTLTLTDQQTAQFPSSGSATVSEQSLMSGGFDNVALKSADVISIDGAVALSTKASITLDAPLLQANAGASLQLTSAHVSLGNYYNQGDYFDNTNGSLNPNATAVLGANAKCFVQCGTLSVQAQLIDVRGVSGWSGFSTENLNSSGDIRFGSAQNLINTPPAVLGSPDDASTAGFRSGLFASGTVNLTSQQAYPTTYTDFTLLAGSAVNVLAAPGTAATPLSAGGRITIDAPTIDQSGVLRAPLGEITLSGTTVALESGSVTSVSANGATIPYGSTQNSDQWTYSPVSGYTEIVTAPVAKTVNLNGNSVFVQKGATLDLSGGGDLLASEWIAGPGGSTDVLNPQSAANQAGVKAYQYAIVPSLGSQFAPLDSQFAQQATSSSYQSIYLSGVPGLAAGYYALLPARYALLPGAYAIRVVQSNSDVAAGSVAQQSSGAYVVAGRLGTAGTDIIDSRTSTVLVAPSSVVQTQSQYTETSGNVFFSSAAAAAHTATPALPADAGALQLAAATSLTLNGSIDFASGSYTTTNSAGTSTVVKGAGGFVSVQAPDIVVTDSATSLASLPSGALDLDAQSLNNLGAATLVLGASVRQTTAGEQINVASTQTIELANTNVALTAPDIILAAQDNVMVDAGAAIAAKGTLNRSPTTLVINGAGALLRASSGSLASVEVEPSTASDYLAQSATGQLSVGSAANVAGTGSVLLYATGNTTADSSAMIVAPALGIYSSRVSLGDVPAGTNAPGGLNLTGQLLSTLTNATQLTIGSSSTIDFYGTVGLGTSGTLQNLTLDAAALDGYDTVASKANVTLQAGSITFENSVGITNPTYSNGVSPMGSGSLTLVATAASSTQSGQITLGSGVKTISGFGAGVALNAAGDILTQGTGSALYVPSNGTDGTPVNLSLTSAALTAAAGSDQTISASGLVSIAQAGLTANAPSAPLGGKIVIDGGTGINQSGTINAPGGIIELNALTGDVVLGNGSVTSAAGAARSFTVTNAVAAGGQVSLSAAQGNVTLASGSTVDVAGATSADGKESGAAGSLSVFAPTGTFASAGSTLEGSAPTGQLQGSFSLDVGSGLAGSGFAALTDALQSGGFTGDLSFRTRTDAGVTIANTTAHPNGVVASSFALSVDQGSIDIQGEINTSGGNSLNTGGGSIALFAQNNLTLEAGAKLLANATSGGPVGVNGTALTTQGGDVTLGTESGSLILNGGTVSMLGSSGVTSDGTLTLRAPRTADQLSVNIQLPTTGTVEVDTHNPMVVEGYQCYGPCTAAARAQPVSNIVLGDPTLGSLDITQNGVSGTPYGDALTFVGNGNGALLATNLAKGFSNDLGASAAMQVQVRAGIEIDSTGDITVGDANTPVWNLEAWNLALGSPVNVTLRAAGNLIFDASLSDGFTPRGVRPIQQWTFGDTSAANNDSASYRLAAGADLAAANPLAVVKQTPTVDPSGIVSGTGNVVLIPGQLIRTGDGNIQIAAGGDVLMGYSADPTGTFTESDPLTTTAIYTAGVASSLSPTALPFSAPASNVNVPSYPTQGGDVTVSAANDIRSAPGAEVPSDWIWRQGNNNTDGTIGLNTSWWVEIGTFQGIGALGGGSVTLNAGADIVDVTAAIATTGRLLGAQGQQPTLNNLALTGGGTLLVRAAGNISSGVYEDDWGNALLTAGGALNATATLSQEVPAAGQGLGFDPSTALIYPMLFIGSGNFTANARSDATINYVGSSTSIPEAAANATRNSSAFFLYGPNSALTLQSTSGNVVLDDDVSALPLTLLNPNGNGNSGLPTVYINGPLAIYPPTLNLVALSGDIEILGDDLPVNLFPSASGQLNLLAQGYITGSTSRNLGAAFNVTMYESDPLQWANVLVPQAAGVIPDGGGQLPVTLLHAADSQPVNIVAETGSISKSELNLPKAANVVAGGDIDDLTLNGKNLAASDVTLVAAGGNITFSTLTAPITNALETNAEGISLAGPGYLEVLAGGTLNLGDGNGILTSGSLTDSRLASNSASVIVGAGFGTNAGGGLRLPAVSSFISTYLAPDKAGAASAYAPGLLAYMQGLDPTTYTSASYATALTGFESLNFQHQLPLLSQVLMNELNQTGLDHNNKGASYDRGYNAINTLFPTKDPSGNALAYQGDIDMFFSQIKTEQGGDINLLAPGGSVIVGVPNPPASLAAVKAVGDVSAAANLGLLVLASGTIKGFADQSFEVNQSRILTLQGGDIILWASNGDIDAGKGAKSASGASPPVIQTDSSGNVFVNPIGDVAGSGIGQLLTGPGETAGLVDLIAPRGTVNAGDAGIRVAGNLNIAALQVIGANNITVGGTATGVPVSEAGALSGALSGANSLGDAAKSAVDQLSQNLNAATNFQQLSESLQPTFVVVKMFCLGVDCQLH